MRLALDSAAYASIQCAGLSSTSTTRHPVSQEVTCGPEHARDIRLSRNPESPFHPDTTESDDLADIRIDLEKMRRAVETLSIATSVEAAFENQSIVVKRGDVALFLSKRKLPRQVDSSKVDVSAARSFSR